MATRSASHAGSWYSGDQRKLDSELNGWLQKVDGGANSKLKALIAPHAGYSYSGPVAAHVYKQMDPSKIKRVFILGPSHHVYLKGCALSQASEFSTPIGNLIADQEVIKELASTNQYEWLDLAADEDEHSIEMHMPYVAKMMAGKDFTVVPIVVGALSHEREAQYGRALAPYLRDPANFFVISSDFCHWGQRFRYTHYDKVHGDVWQSIEALDRSGMDAISSMDPKVYARYQDNTENTICGRHPIAVLLNMLEHSGNKHRINFLKYAQSSKCMSVRDSSVSYAAGAVIVE